MHIWNVGLIIGIATTVSANGVGAQTATAFKTGEETTGMTKQCSYNALGNDYTLTISSVRLCPLTIKVRTNITPDKQAPTVPEPAPRTVTAFKTGENTTGMTKQCFYNALGSGYTRTISSVALCPLSIQVRAGGS